jgi:hypothetical protein
MKDVGARWVRLNVNWQSSPSSYSRAVDLSRNAGSRIVMMADGTVPSNPADYAAAMRNFASYYAGRVEAYEVWNEENLQRFWPSGPNPGQYAALLRAAYPAIKAGDPNAKVVFGGLSLNDYQFVEGAYAAVPDLGRYFDVMATHPYTWGATYPEAAWTDPSTGRMHKGAFAAYREVRATMLAHGDDKPIWFTEFGWATTTSPGEGVDAATQADYLTRALRCVEQDPYVQVALWYNLRNSYFRHDEDSWNGQLGLMYTDFSKKPAYYSFKSYGPGAGGCVYGQPQSAAGQTAASTAASTATAAALRLTSISLRVRRRATARAASRRSGRPVLRRSLTVAGHVRNAKSGRVLLRFQRRAGGRWRSALAVKTRVSAAGRFSRFLRSSRLGLWRVRALYLGAPDARRSYSRYIRFRL